MDNSDAHCSFCGNGKDEVRKLIAGVGRRAADDHVLPAVAICSECVASCANVCREGRAEIESDLHVELDEIVRAAIEVLTRPRPGFGTAPEERGWLMRALGTVLEALIELESDRSYRGVQREITDDFFVEAARRVWNLIDDLRTARATGR